MLNSKKENIYLGIETSCDDTSVALVQTNGFVLDILKYTKDEDHRPFGGILPERASRNHLKSLLPLIEKILDKNKMSFPDLNGICVTSRPGLMGSLLVGTVAAKTLSQVFDLPLVFVNHLEGHIYSPWLYDTHPSKASRPVNSTDPKSLTNYESSRNTTNSGEDLNEILFPHLSLIVSGGHTQLVLVKALGQNIVLGATRDDAVGEAIDKFSKEIGLGFPGGPMVDKASQGGDSLAYNFPRPMIKEEGYDFSFSGLKASAVRALAELKEKNTEPFSEKTVANFSASYMQAATDVLIHKLKKAVLEYKPKIFTVVGGVSANSLLRKRCQELSQACKTPFKISEIKYCTDNGAMIALVGGLRIEKGLQTDNQDELFQSPSARSLKGDFL